MKNKFKKMLSLLLASLMLLTCVLASCETPTENPDETDETEYESTGETIPLDEAVSIIEDGKTDYVLVRPKNASDDLFNLIMDFRENFEKKTGIKLEIKIESEKDADNDDYEILIGETLRPETQEVFKDLKYKEFFFGAVENKIVIVGGSYESTKIALNLFVRKHIDGGLSEDKKTLNYNISENYIEKVNYPVSEFKIDGNEAKNYKIVYSEDDMYAAKIFATRLYYLVCDRYGYRLPIVNDSEPKGEREILIGNTNRGTVEAPEDNLHVECKDGNIYLSSPYSEGYTELYDYCNSILSTSGSIILDNGTKQSTPLADLFTGGTENILTKGGDIRIMVNNIWSGNEASAPASYRAKQLADVFSDYAPDVLGLQEFSGVISKELSALIKKLGYKEVPYNESNMNISVQTPLYYNPDTVEHIYSGFWRYTDESGDKSKSVSWGIFKHKETGKIFCAGTTHFYWTSDELGNASRIIDAKDLSKLVKEIMDKYNCPIIIGGDYNCNISSEPLNILKDNGLVDAENIALKTEKGGTHHAYPTFNTETKVCNVYYEARGDYSTAIDHIYCYGEDKMTVNVYDVVEDYFALASSDHCPMLVDITVK